MQCQPSLSLTPCHTQMGNKLAGYVLIFLLCPTNPAIPSAFTPVGIIPTDLTYTGQILGKHLDDIAKGLHAAGFRHFRVATAADNAAVHRKHLGLMGRPDACRGQRDEGGIGVELGSDARDAILTLAAYRYKG